MAPPLQALLHAARRSIIFSRGFLSSQNTLFKGCFLALNCSSFQPQFIRAMPVKAPLGLGEIMSKQREVMAFFC
ncbi:MAG TPA: hypothetical protein PK457_08805 [Methylotenera sp.]|nr:hypothetical protein [Methylotenera sp.]